MIELELNPRIERAASEWVEAFNAIPTDFIKEHRETHIEDWEEVTVIDPEDDEPDSVLPMWGHMWTFSANPDIMWCEDNLDTMSKLGFRIYYNETLGYVFGIDGMGYSFMQEHFIPLYKARGLKWHC